jgi:hypothetical protein
MAEEEEEEQHGRPSQHMSFRQLKEAPTHVHPQPSSQRREEQEEEEGLRAEEEECRRWDD